MLSYAEVAVDAPVGYDRTLSYRIPPHIELEPGQMVLVPLGPRPVQGIVYELTEHPRVEVTRDLLAPVEPSPLIAPLGLELSRWISRYYMSPLFDAASLMLPPGFQSRIRPYIRVSPQHGSPSPPVTPTGQAALDYLSERGGASERDIERVLGRDGPRDLRYLLRRGILQRRWELRRPRAFHRYDCYVRPTMTNGQDGIPSDLPGERAPRQAALYGALARAREPMPLATARKEYGPGAVDGLVAKGLLALEWVRVDRGPALQSQVEVTREDPLVLTPEQERSLAAISAALDEGRGSSVPFLLHGVTGSGKTEVYLRALERCVQMGNKGIYLVPEISLTPQTVHRLNARFPGRVAVHHSGLTAGEAFDQWWRIRDGEYDVVVGPRSALFAPLPDLGLIVIDEEHEWTYKQQDASPRYHAREVALRLAKDAGAVVVMGSATPDVETYQRATRAQFRLLELPRRIAPMRTLSEHPSNLASVEVCDMRTELREGNRSIFSRSLATALNQCIDRDNQAILFLNRRGAATVVQCRDCGWALKCRRCTVTLTYHSSDRQLRCHLCNHRARPPKACPKCRSPRIRYLGMGTQRVVEELTRLMPGVSSLRWDGDTARGPNGHERIMERFLRGDARVLIGTQMVAKGLHMPNVSLVGVILADIGLNLPDFRAGERAFQLLSQVAGRAGRGPTPGKVIIQTYVPTSYAIEAAARQDYAMFHGREIHYRRLLRNPPFNRLVRLLYSHMNASACQRDAEKMARTLRHRVDTWGLADVEIVGPAPAFPQRVRGKYRWHILLRGSDLHTFLEGVSVPQDCVVDVDPVSVL